MRQVRYNVAASLDGYIATSDGRYDWIPVDPAVDFATIFAKVDTVLMGRHTYELTVGTGAHPWAPGTRIYVFSTTLVPAAHPGVTVVNSQAKQAVARLRAEPGDGDIWLFGGGALFLSMLAARQIDTVEVTIVPVLLGGGVPLITPGAPRTPLQLTGTQRYPSGMVSLSYSIPDRDL